MGFEPVIQEIRITLGFVATHWVRESKNCATRRWGIPWRACASGLFILIRPHLDIVLWLHRIHNFSTWEALSVRLGTCMGTISALCPASCSSVAMGSCCRALDRHLGELETASLWGWQKPSFQFAFEAFPKGECIGGTVHWWHSATSCLVSPHLGEPMWAPALSQCRALRVMFCEHGILSCAHPAGLCC